jgi:molybdate transport system permease protein
MDVNHPIVDALILSLLVASSATLLVFGLGLWLAWLLYRGDFAGRSLLSALITAPMVMPPTVMGYLLVVLLGREGLIGAPLYQLTGWSPIFTWQGAALAAMVVSLPLMVRVCRAAFENVDRELVLMSYSLGKSRWQTFRKVVLPLSRGGVWAGTILSFARALGEFGATLMVAGNIPGKTATLPLALYSAFQSGDDPLARQLAWILTGVSLLAIILAERWSRKPW